jgi:hypothetical protein
MAQTIFIAGGPKRRIPVYMMKKFDFIRMLEAVQKYRITNLIMVPPIVVVCISIPIHFFHARSLCEILQDRHDAKEISLIKQNPRR